MVMSDVKEEEVVNRVTKMAAELHFSGDWSSISGMKVPGCREHGCQQREVHRQVCYDGPKLFQYRMSSIHLLFVILITQTKPNLEKFQTNGTNVILKRNFL